MATEGRVRISLSSGELEVEGSADFVASYDSAIKDLLEKLASGQAYKPSASTVTAPNAASAPEQGAVAPVSAGKELGEVLNQLPSNTSAKDQILIAAWFAAGDEQFGTGDANKLLVDHGVKLSNAAQSMRQNLSAKRVFRAGSNKWRIAMPGKEYLKSLGVI